jgi:hypothetical protein
MGNLMPLPPFQSSMERFPDHVKAIGMISIEVGNMDIFLGYLFAAILQIDGSVGKEIFITPNSATARLTLLETAIKEVLVDESEGKRLLLSIHKRAWNIVEKRQKMMHDSWGVNVEGMAVRQPIRGRGKMTLVPLAQLETMNSDIRTLVEAIRFHTDKLRHDALLSKNSPS